MMKELRQFLVPTLLVFSVQFEEAYAEQGVVGLPPDATVIEKQTVKPGREILLWMVKPSKNPRDPADGELYTCPEESRGNFFRGPTRVSLVDTGSRKIINTVNVKQDYNSDLDEFDIPYSIHAGSYYEVPGIKKGSEGKPTILNLKDYNGDGKPFEFALYDAEACMGLQTSLIGYSEKQDKVIQYPASLEETSSGKTTNETMHWVDYLFSKMPDKDGTWKFEIDYRGRGGTLDRYEVRYNKELETFQGKVDFVEGG